MTVEDDVTSAELQAFLRWGAKQKDFPYGQVSYWISAYERGDGKDMYGRTIEPSQQVSGS
jgi:hypothetical protein